MARPTSEHLEWAARQAAACRLCPRDCRVDRRAGQVGRCGAPGAPAYFMEYVHYGEEDPLRPSHTVFLTGCNMDCVFCHTADDRARLPARQLTPAAFDRLVARGRAEGARNVNVLGGEPSVSLPGVLEVLDAAADLPRLVWNTNMYVAPDTVRVLCDVVDVFLADLKFGGNRCASTLAGVDDYWDVVRDRLIQAHERDTVEMILRHLVLPGHFECCTRPALTWAAEALPRSGVSLKLDYLVMPRARGDDRLGAFLRRDEADAARSLAAELGLSLVTSSPPVGDLAGPRDGRVDEGRELEAEVVISPKGDVYLRHPVRQMMGLGSPDEAGRQRKDGT